MARPSSGANLAIADLQRILGQRQHELKKLYKQRTRLERDLDGVDREIARIEGSGGGRGGRRGGGPGSRARNDKSLADTLEDVLRSKSGPLGVGDIMEAVLATGYRSNAANFRGIINQQLIKERKRFQKAGRGMYQIKGGGGGRKKAAEAAAA
jgi:hypothetical protein